MLGGGAFRALALFTFATRGFTFRMLRGGSTFLASTFSPIAAGIVVGVRGFAAFAAGMIVAVGNLLSRAVTRTVVALASLTAFIGFATVANRVAAFAGRGQSHLMLLGAAFAV